MSDNYHKEVEEAITQITSSLEQASDDAYCLAGQITDDEEFQVELYHTIFKQALSFYQFK